MSILIIAEHDNAVLKELTLNVITAASQMAVELHLLVAGHDCQPVAEQAARIQGINKVLLVESEIYQHHLAENLAKLVSAVATTMNHYTHIVAAASTTGKNFMPRVAALLDVGQISDITGVGSPSTFERPIYAGNAIATVQSLDNIKVVTVRSSAFAAAEMTAPNSANVACEIETLGAVYDLGMSTFVCEEVVESERPDLTVAKVVISGGRGLASGENFALLEQLADKLGGAVGASRAAVDAGYVPNDMQVGQTGKIVAPELYIAVGLSGAIQHLAGMKDSKVIVAVNKDAEAPIFQVADYGLVADLFDVLPELLEKL